MNKQLLTYVLSWVILFSSSRGLAWTELADRGRTLQFSGQVLFTEENSLRPSYPIGLILTAMPLGHRWVLGITGHHWLTPSSLKMATLGGLLGIQFGNPRIRYRLLGGTQLPLGIENSLGREPLWEAKIQSLLKFNQVFSWTLEGGYLYTKNPVNKLGGLFVGTGIGIHF